MRKIAVIERETGMSRSDLTALYAPPQTADATGQGLAMEDHVKAGNQLFWPAYVYDNAFSHNP